MYAVVHTAYMCNIAWWAKNEKKTSQQLMCVLLKMPLQKNVKIIDYQAFFPEF